MPQVEVTPDGWLITDAALFRLVHEREPPRWRVFWVQLWEDARSWRPLAFWAVGIGLIVLAVTTDSWPLLPLGVMALAVYGRMFLGAVRNLRDTPTAVGVIDRLSPHPMVKECSTATATTPDGQRVPVVVDTVLVADTLDMSGRAEVLFLHDSQSEFCLVVGARAAR